MNDIQWSLSLKMNPLQLSNPRVAFGAYVKSLTSKYVPELKGILVNVDKHSVKVRPSPCFSTPWDTDSACIVQLDPQRPYAKVNLLVNATVFRPAVGLQLDVIVLSAGQHSLVCRYGDTFSIYITIKLVGEDAAPIPNDPSTGARLRIFSRDLLRVEVSKVDFTSSGDAVRLCGRVLSLLKRRKVDKSAPDTRSIDGEASCAGLAPAKRKKFSNSNKFCEESEGGEHEIANGRRQEVRRIMKPDPNVDSPNPTRAKKSKRHLGVLPQESEHSAVTEEFEEALFSETSDSTVTSKRRRSKKQSVQKVEEQQGVSQATATEEVAEHFRDPPSDGLTPSKKRKSRSYSAIDQDVHNLSQPSVFIKPDPDAVVEEPVPRRKSSKRNKIHSKVDDSETRRSSQSGLSQHPFSLKPEPPSSGRLEWQRGGEREVSPNLSSSCGEDSETGGNAVKPEGRSF